MIDLNKIGKDGVEFIKKEFGITEDDLEKFDKDAWHELRLKCFDIECEEIDEDVECSDRGESAADIVDLLYCEVRAE